VCGPNGFFREFLGNANDPLLIVSARYSATGDALNGNIEISLTNRERARALFVNVAQQSYKSTSETRSVSPGATETFTIGTQDSYRWYDLAVNMTGIDHYSRRFAGRVETGQWSVSDPAMGGIV